VFAGKKSAQIREILISESAWEEMTCLFAPSLGKYQGKQADRERHQKVLYYRQVKKLSIRETADATGYSASQVCRIQALYKNNEFS
ncbi:helix-turn-helix domain-containing protein, partial [Escherichia coli]|uniref:helix-turn-helix domain-containing protein n=1 Tax=Escherichia coli TaxID=562 RepID=UPI003EE504C6